MAFGSCVGARSYEALLQAVDEAVRDDVPARLERLLASVPAEALEGRHVLHQAAWLGHVGCVRLLLEHGADPEQSHRRNGCTPLHLAHFCTIEDSSPEQTIRALVAAGASVNSPGGRLCGMVSLDHAIQHQRQDSIEALLQAGAHVALPSLLIAIDVANPRILERLLRAGGQCGPPLPKTGFWGQPLHRVLYSPLKCPRECYKQMFRLFVQATVCQPPMDAAVRPAGNVHLMIETELRTTTSDYVDLAQYLYAYLVRNGFCPTDSIKNFMNSHGEITWISNYLRQPPPLRDLCVRTARTHLYHSGNILYGTDQLKLPARLKNLIMMYNPQ